MGGAVQARLLWCLHPVGASRVLFLSFLGRWEGTADWETWLGWRGGRGQFCLSACLVSTGGSLGSCFSRALQGFAGGRADLSEAVCRWRGLWFSGPVGCLCVPV